jgi:dTDP-4-amino-4,6-dideoxygalactose transaminase
MSEIKLLERRLAEYVGRKYCICTGSGTAALVVALQSLEFPKKSGVVIPSIVCPTVAFAVTYSGLEPLFCDVNIHDYQISPKSIYNVLSEKTKVIIPVHLFGQSYNVDAIEKIANMHSLVIIEDAAQSFGGQHDGKKHGSLGDLSVVSFGYTKIIDATKGLLTGGGGAIFTDDKTRCEKAKAIVSKWDQYNAKLVENFYLKNYNSLFRICGKTYKKSKGLLNFYKAIPRIMRYFKKMFIYRMPLESVRRVLSQLDSIDEKTEIRMRNANLYKRLLTTNKLIHPRYTRESGVYFRYSPLFEPDCRQKFINELSKRHVPISTLYSPLRLMYAGKPKLPNSEYVGSHIFNLPVDPSINEESVGWIASQVNDVAEGQQAEFGR